MVKESKQPAEQIRGKKWLATCKRTGSKIEPRRESMASCQSYLQGAYDAIDEHISFAWHEAQADAHSTVRDGFREIQSDLREMHKAIAALKASKKLSAIDVRKITTILRNVVETSEWIDQASDIYMTDCALNASMLAKEMNKLRRYLFAKAKIPVVDEEITI